MVLFGLSDGGAGDMVPSAHVVDGKHGGDGSFFRTYFPPPVWCVEWRSSAGCASWGGLLRAKEEDECAPICCHSRWPPEAAQGLLQGVPPFTLLGDHLRHCWRIPGSPPYAGIKLSSALVRPSPINCVGLLC